MADKQRKATKRKRGPGRPWPKGQSGNPKGRPPNTKFLSERLREALEADDGAMAGWVIAALLVHTGKTVDAIKIIFDRTEGKVPQPIVPGDDDRPFRFTLEIDKANAGNRD